MYMDSATLVSLIALWAALALVVVPTVVFARSLGRENQRLRSAQQDAAKSRRNLQAKVAAERRGTRERLDLIEKRCAELDEKLLNVEARQQRAEGRGVGSRPYELAVQMAARGASPEELIAAGLSRGEAELALHMHGLIAHEGETSGGQLR
jgi:hypothetical protein